MICEKNIVIVNFVRMPTKKKAKGKKKGKKGKKTVEKPGDPFVKNEIPSPLKPGERVGFRVKF